MGFSRQEYWSGLPCPPSGDLPDPGIKPASLTSPALAGESFATSATWEALNCMVYNIYLNKALSEKTISLATVWEMDQSEASRGLARAVKKLLQRSGKE